MKNTLILLFCLFAIKTVAQNLTGKWEGSFANKSYFEDSTNFNYKFELNVIHNKKK